MVFVTVQRVTRTESPWLLGRNYFWALQQGEMNEKSNEITISKKRNIYVIPQTFQNMSKVKGTTEFTWNKMSILLLHNKFLGKMSKLFVHRMRLVYIGSSELISDLTFHCNCYLLILIFKRLITIKYFHASKNSDLISENNWEAATQQQMSCDCYVINIFAWKKMMWWSHHIFNCKISLSLIVKRLKHFKQVFLATQRRLALFMRPTP